jgi:glucosamine-6-phosphate deaminase
MKKLHIENAPEFRRLENLPIDIQETYEETCKVLAQRVARLIQRNTGQGRKTVLGLVAGTFVVGVYREWVRLHQEGELDFSQVVAFSMDEYFPITADSVQSHHLFLRENLFNRVNIPETQIHLFPTTDNKVAADKFCREYEAEILAAGGIDVQLLEVGKVGHIGFNEPGTASNTRTRRVSLDEVTRKRAAVDFFSEDNVPEFGLTMGLGTVLDAKEICLMAIGESVAPLIQKTLEGPITTAVGPSLLQNHPQTMVFVDQEAASELTRVRKPWTLGEVRWTPELQYRAVIELSEEAGVPLSKLDTSDYAKGGLNSLLRAAGPADALSNSVAHSLTQKIRHTSDFFEKTKVLIFSPHPDDDVICMGGTMQKLVERKNRVDVAVMTSGNVAVFDEDALRHLEFIERLQQALGFTDARVTKSISELMGFLKKKKIGEIDLPGVQDVKRIIRESEAVAAIETLKISREHAHFLNLPFYRTGQVKKDPIGEADVEIVLDLLKNLKPDIIFVAGDMTDPHGTHRMCKEAIDQALARMKKPPEVWLYRGAWQEWDIHDVDVFVPLSKAEAKQKTLAIFKHESQKDRAVFPGPYDDREFWQRAEDRNRETAQALDRLGLQEYFAMEAFVIEPVIGAV